MDSQNILQTGEEIIVNISTGFVSCSSASSALTQTNDLYVSPIRTTRLRTKLSVEVL